MAQVINTNLASLNAQRTLGLSQRDAATAMERLSSGLRVNSAKDDAAGLAIASRLTSQINGLNQAVRNASDATSVVSIAEGALQETSNILQRMRELAVQSANATYSANDRLSIQAEVTTLVAEVDRIASATAFGQTNLLDGSFTSQNFQVGADVGETLALSISSAKAADLGAVNTITFDDTPIFAHISAANASESAVEAQTLTWNVGSTDYTVSIADSSSAKASAAAINANVPDVTAQAKTTVLIDEVDGTGGGETIHVHVNGTELADLDFTSEANFHTALKNAINTNTALSHLTVTTTATSTTIVDADGDDISISVSGQADAAADHIEVTARNFANGADVGSAQVLDNTDSVIVTGDLKFTTSRASTETITMKTNVATGSGGFLANANTADAAIFAASTDRISTVSVRTASAANDAIGVIDAAIKSIDSARASLGATESRLDSVTASLSNQSTNSAAAKSRIMDADFASETAALAKNQILQQAGISILAQANAQPQNVLALLQ